MTNDQVYLFDVAVSFVQADEELATRLDELLSGRVKTFLYTKHQGALVGRDGESRLNDVFSRDSRLVVILYRKGWGDTPWTRIEKTAIKNRAFDNGYDFTLFVPLDTTGLPPWVPRTQIWFDIGRWGLEALAAITERRVAEVGGVVTAETAEDSALRLARELAEERERRALLYSEAGVKAAREEVHALYEQVKEIAARLNYITNQENDVLDIYTSGFTLSISWSNPYVNTTDDSYLHVVIFRGRPRIGDMRFASTPVEIERTRFQPDTNMSRGFGWRRESDSWRYVSTVQVVELCFDFLTSRVREQLLPHRRSETR